MRKKTISALLLLSVCISCQDFTETTETGVFEYRFELVNENDIDSRSSLNGNYLSWDNGDLLGFVLKKGDAITETSRTRIDKPENKASFGFTSSTKYEAGDMLYAIYPRIFESSVLREPDRAFAQQYLEIPSVQSHKAGKFNGQAMPMVSVPFEFSGDMNVDSNNQMEQVRFLNLGSLLEFHIFGAPGEIIQDVTFEADKNIAGVFQLDVTKVTPGDESTLAVNLSDYLFSDIWELPLSKSVKTETDAVVGTSRDDASPVRMVIAPGTYSGNIIVRTDKAYYVHKLSAAMEFKRNRIYPLGIDLGKSVRAVVQQLDQTTFRPRFQNSANPYENVEWAGNICDGNIYSFWALPGWTPKHEDPAFDDFNYEWSSVDYTNDEWACTHFAQYRPIPDAIIVLDMMREVTVARIGFQTPTEGDWPWGQIQDLKKCEVYISKTFNFQPVNPVEGKFTGGGTVANYDNCNEGNDWKLLVDATLSGDYGTCWFDAVGSASESDRTGRYLKIRPTAAFAGRDIWLRIREILVDYIPANE